MPLARERLEPVIVQLRMAIVEWLEVGYPSADRKARKSVALRTASM